MLAQAETPDYQNTSDLEEIALSSEKLSHNRTLSPDEYKYLSGLSALHKMVLDLRITEGTWQVLAG